MTTVGSCSDRFIVGSRASSSGTSSAASGTCVSSAVVCDMRWMNNTDPSAKPTTIASVSPLNKVMPNVAKQHGRVAARRPQQGCESVALEHVPAHDREHRGEDGQRNVARERRRHQNEQEQEQRMRHAGDRTARPCPHVRCGSRHGARSRRCRRTVLRQCSRPPARPVRNWSDGDVRSCCRRRRRRAAIRSRRAARTRSRWASQLVLFADRTAAAPAAADRAECRRTETRWSRPAA